MHTKDEQPSRLHQRRVRVLRRAVAVFVAVGFPLTAHADTASCARVLERARDLRSAGKLDGAVREMEACTACPALADVCEQTRASMRAAQPSLSVTARGGDGEPLDDAIIAIDGTVVAQGLPIEVDPGPHTVRAKLGARIEEQTVLVSEGEHRKAKLRLSETRRPAPPGAFVLGAVSGVMLATAAGLWAWSMNAPSSGSLTSPLSRDDTMPRQTRADLVLAAEIALAVSVTTLATAVVVWLTRPIRVPRRPD